MLFTVEIDEEWLDALDSLIQTTLGNAKAGIIGGSMTTPEEVLAVSIFFQFRLQRLKLALSRKERDVVMFPYDPEPQDVAGYWGGCEDVHEAFYPEDQIEEYLVPRCFSCGAEAEEWEITCFRCGDPVG